ncbi:hypothetical protein ABZ924_01145 [Streptomyces sp. NPDC046876]|uniref:LppU/SCO3897 family protein n=1 Tax=Streptomyces sp. NPDC046876 TaxID=3155616 RepID=UPI0033D8FFFF
MSSHEAQGQGPQGPQDSRETPISLTPQQAATGVVITVPLPDGTTATLRIPPARNGDLVRARIGDREVLLRVQIAGAPAQTPAKTNPLGCLLGLAIAIAVIAGIVALSNNDDDDHKRPIAVPTFSYSPAPLPSLNLNLDPTTAAPEPSPYDEGTCLNGSLPDSTTATRVTGVKEVPCSASDAHYRVIQRFSFTKDMNRCNTNPDTQYAFSHSYTRNGVPINEYVYCLVGLGSYARP